MAPSHKLLLEISGTSLVRRVADIGLSADLDPVVVVLGHRASEVRSQLDGLPLTFAVNEAPESGLSSSIRTGLEELDSHAPTVAAALIMLADMPWVRPGDVAALLAAFDPGRNREICVPTYEGRRGNPVLWSARFFSAMKGLRGDVGARRLMEQHPDAVYEVPVDASGVVRDVDTPEAL